MTVTTEDLGQFTGQKVIVVRTVEGKSDAVEVEGTAETANALGILLRPKGRSQLELIEPSEIVEVRFAPQKIKTLKAAELGVVGYGNARKHLLARHGYTLSAINELSEEDALGRHNEINHEADDLGHVHKEKSDDSPQDSSEEDSEGE